MQIGNWQPIPSFRVSECKFRISDIAQVFCPLIIPHYCAFNKPLEALCSFGENQRGSQDTTLGEFGDLTLYRLKNHFESCRGGPLQYLQRLFQPLLTWLLNLGLLQDHITSHHITLRST